jgi:hypothetical protein
MSHGHDVYKDSEARWFSAFVPIDGSTRMVFCFAVSQDDAIKASNTEDYGMSGVSEYQQVAALVCMDLDTLAVLCDHKDMTADDYRAHIRHVVSAKNELISDAEVRNQRYAAAAFVFNAVAGGAK